MITLDTSLGTVSVHESLEGGRYYVAPKFRFLFVQPKNEVIAQIAALPLAGSTTVQMRLEVINSASRRQVLEELNKTVDKKIVATDVRNLEVDGIIIRLASEDQESEYRVKPCIIRHPQPSSETLDLVFSVAKKTSHEFIKMVNDGKITFNVSYTYNKISIDSRVEELSATTLIDTKAVRDLKMDGSEVMTAKQFADFSKTIQNEITSKVILGFGKIEMESIPVTKLMDLFKVGDLVSMTAKQIEDADRTAAATTNLKVDPKEFQPFKYQKKVVETLASDKTIEEHKKEYATLYTAEKVKIHASASGKAGGGIWSAKAKGEYDKETEKKVSEGKLTDEEFKDHIQTYHGVEYTEQLVQRRGLEIYSVEKVRAMGTTKIISVTIRPTLTTGALIRNSDSVSKSLDLRRSCKDLRRESRITYQSPLPVSKAHP